MKQIIKKKQKVKEKKKDTVLLLDYECLTREEILVELTEIRKALKKIFKNHIGEENFITPYQLFKEVFGIDPTYIDVFKRGYWWNILKNSLRVLRNNDDAFIINTGRKLYVLKTKGELIKFEDRCDREIENIKNVKIKANDWVKKRKWSRL
jgi:hypothetical protein